ncbi:hypothetical protein BSKO_08024 [Bryopsis sp. KO-2023]|nr:hypothetical protein BSKO_08024 [Bryopsis sp. KO-2023]
MEKTETQEGKELARQKRSTLWTVCPFILGNELCERLAYYGIATNLINYLILLGASNVTSSVAINVFTGVCYTMPLIGGWLADAHWGRYKTILVLSIVYCLGMLFTALTAYVPGLHPDTGEKANSLHWTLLFGSLFLVAAGTGGIKPNVSSFGADQFDETNPKDVKEKASFFNWFYLSINVGAFIAATVIVKIQSDVSWALGFLIPGVAMLLAVVFFVVGTSLYKHVAPTGSPITRVMKIVKAAIVHRNQRPEQQKLLAAEEEGGSSADHHNTSHWLYRATAGGFTKRQVYEVVLVWGIIPVFLTNIFFWMVYSQITNTFILQGGLMNRHLNIFGWHYNMPAASVTLFDTLIIVIMIPIYDQILIPILTKFNKQPTNLQRIGWGYVMAVISMVAAFFVERRRLHLFGEGQLVDGEKEGDSAVVDMSIWWQSILYALVGASEVLASIGQLEFFYDQAPDVMRSMMMAMNLLSVALGGYLAGGLIAIVNFISKAAGNEWIADDLNKGRLDLYFLTVGGLMLVVTLWFLFVALKYEYKVVEHKPQPPPTTDPNASREEAEAEEGFLPYSRSLAYRPSTPAAKTSKP